jgi:hypothetical protein
MVWDRAVPINLLVEGATDEVVVRRVLAYAGFRPGTAYGKKGKSDLLRRLPTYNQAARFTPWFVTVDLDHDAPCAPEYVRMLLPEREQGLLLRIAVREMEAWLLADADQIASYLGISPALVPREPDAEENPKRTLVNLARRSTRSAIKNDIVPREGSGREVGPGYEGAIIEFVTKHGWRPEVAAQRSDSLQRCLRALETLKP